MKIPPSSGSDDDASIPLLRAAADDLLQKKQALVDAKSKVLQQEAVLLRLNAFRLAAHAVFTTVSILGDISRNV